MGRILEGCEQGVPDELRAIAKEVAAGSRPISKEFFKKKQRLQQAYAAFGGTASGNEVASGPKKKSFCWFAARGHCEKGTFCPYSHDATSTAPAIVSGAPCWYFMNTICAKGAACPFDHDINARNV